MLMTASASVVLISRRVRRTSEENNLIIRIDKYEAELTIIIKRLSSSYCTVEANYRQTQSRGLSATELLVNYCDSALGLRRHSQGQGQQHCWDPVGLPAIY